MISGLKIFTEYRVFVLQDISLFRTLMLLLALLSPFSPLAQSQLKAAESPATLLEALQERNTEIDEREKKVKEREGRLDLLEKEIRGMLDEYVKLKEIVDQRESAHTLALKKEREVRIKRLAKIYQAMDAKEAAERIKKMKKSTALSLLRTIKEKQAAKILSNINAATATQFSEAFIKPDK